MVERALSMREVKGSMPFFSTHNSFSTGCLWTRSQFDSGRTTLGGLAQMAERVIRIHQVRGSMPLSSISKSFLSCTVC